jgi:dolichol kinase
MEFREIGRKVIHFLWFLVLLGYLEWGLWFVFYFFAAFILIDLLRVEFDFKIPFFSKFIREEEKERFFTPTLTLAGMLISLAMFEKYIAFTAICMMIFGDLAAGIVGSFFTGFRFRLWNYKTIPGTIAGLIVNLIVGFVLLQSIPLVFVMAVTATLVEMVISKLNDNFYIPVITGLVAQVFMYFLS